MQVVCTIHQPNSDITRRFDDLMLLANGRVVYFGAWNHAVDHFSELGYPYVSVMFMLLKCAYLLWLKHLHGYHAGFLDVDAPFTQIQRTFLCTLWPTRLLQHSYPSSSCHR